MVQRRRDQARASATRKRWEDQDQWQGGWALDKQRPPARCAPAAGVRKLLSIFANPRPARARRLLRAVDLRLREPDQRPARSTSPVARPESQISGEDHEDRLGARTGTTTSPARPSRPPPDPNCARIEERRCGWSIERTFMMYLPRICEHCLNPSCVASCPSGAMYKRDEDGIVLVDQDQCRGWRMCVTGCPYKKVYFNRQHRQGREVHALLPAGRGRDADVCSETCVGRIRYLGIVLYDADRVQEAASVRDEHDFYAAQLDVFLDPDDPAVRSQARRDGIPARLARRRPALPCLGARSTATRSRCRCTPNTGRCRWSGTCRRSRRWSTCCATPVTTPMPPQPVRRDRRAAHPDPLPGRAVHRR